MILSFNGWFESVISHHVHFITYITQIVFMNMTACKNLFAISKVPSWCWRRFWSPLALGCETFRSPLHLGSRSTSAGGAWSDLQTVLRKVALWCLINGSAITLAGFREFGSTQHSMTVSALLQFFHKESIVVCTDLSKHIWKRSQMSCMWSISSCSILVVTVVFRILSLSLSLIFWAVSSCRFINALWDICYPQYYESRQRVGKSNMQWSMKIGYFLQCTCENTFNMYLLIPLWIVIHHLGGCNFHLLKWG